MKYNANYQLNLNNIFMFTNLIRYSIIAILFSGLLIIFATNAQGNTRKSANREKAGETSQITILVIGFGNNITSNYFPLVDAAEKLEIPYAEYDSVLNQKLSNEFQELDFRKVRFATASSYYEVGKLRNMLFYPGEMGNAAHIICQTHNQELIEVIRNYEADYMVVYGQYQLKWQEEPFNTLFHILDYTVFDSNLQEIYRGQEHFNTFSLARTNELQRNFQRLVKRNANTIYKAIQPSK